MAAAIVAVIAVMSDDVRIMLLLVSLSLVIFCSFCLLVLASLLVGLLLLLLLLLLLSFLSLLVAGVAIVAGGWRCCRIIPPRLASRLDCGKTFQRQTQNEIQLVSIILLSISLFVNCHGTMETTAT